MYFERFYTLIRNKKYSPNIKQHFCYGTIIFGLVMVVSISLSYCTREKVVNRPYDKELYVLGEKIFYPRLSSKAEGVNCYIVTSKDIDNIDKERWIYEYGLLPVDSVAGTYQKSDIIQLDHTNYVLQDYLDNNTDCNMLFVFLYFTLCATIVFVIVVAYCVFVAKKNFYE